MDRVLLLALALLLAGTSPVAGAQTPSAKAVSPAPPALPTPHVTAIVGELEVDRIIEVHVDQLEDWNLALPENDIDTFRAPHWTARRFMRELVSDDEGCSISRFQMLAWTVALVIVFLADVFDDLQMPVFGPELLYLLGLSTGTYVAHRLPEMQRDRQRQAPA